MMQIPFYCSDEAALLALAEKLAPQLKPGFIVFLRGELGAGKTSLARGMLRALGYQDKVKSPTYNLFETYELPEFQVCHIDLYRLDSPEALDELGLRDYFDGQHVCFVEWPEQAEVYLPTPTWDIRIAVAGVGRELMLPPDLLS